MKECKNCCPCGSKKEMSECKCGMAKNKHAAEHKKAATEHKAGVKEEKGSKHPHEKNKNW